jgi:hypothetical protein
MAEISPLRRRMIEDMTVRNLSPATQRSYLAAVSKLSGYFGWSPDRLDLEDIRAFQVHLVAIGISWPALDQIVCALRFFFGVTLGQDATGAHQLCTRAEQAAGRAERRRSRALSGGNSKPQEPYGADDGLCRWPARVGAGSSEDHRHRQQADGDPGRAG